MEYTSFLKEPVQDIFMGLTVTLGPFSLFDSASRLQMVTSHTGQALGVRKPDIPRIMTGYEGELATYTFKTKIPCDCYVVSVHRKYIPRLEFGANSTHVNPLTTIIYQNAETGEYDCIDVEHYSNHHDVFAHRYKINPLINQLVEGQPLREGTILADSPNIHDDCIYGTGLQVEMAYISVLGTTEDSYVISDELAERAAPIEWRKSTASWGKTHYPLNIYGDKYHFKAYPDIGDHTREDGLIFALRESSPLFDCIEKAENSLGVVDTIFDKLTYGIPGAEVFNIEAETGRDETRHSRPMVPEGMSVQTDGYIANATRYYNEIIDVYHKLLKQSGNNCVISPRLQNRVTRALADQPNSSRSRGNNKGGIIRRTYRDKPLDAYHVTISYCHYKPIKRGAKFTGRHGNKGVVGDIWPKENMPRDKDGNIADMIAFSKGAVSRLNPGQFYEQFLSAAIRDMAKVIRVQMDRGDPHEQIWNGLLQFYEAVSPEFVRDVLEIYTGLNEQQLHLKEIYDNGIYVVVRPTDPHLGPNQVRAIRKIIEPTYGPVTYVNEQGITAITEENVFIGALDIILLEKTNHTAMSTSSTSLQQHGLVAGSSKVTRESHPSKQQSTRVFGETEVRLLAGSLGRKAIAELLDHANSPTTHREVVRSILHNPESNYIPNIVNREQYPVGSSRAQGFIRNLLRCRGTKIVQPNKEHLAHD